MSKQSLHNTAKQHSGISYEDSIKALTLTPSLYHRIGQEEGCKRLSTLFYDRVFNDNDAQWFLNIFSSSTKSEAIDNQYRFFVQTFGGPQLYKEKKGKFTRLAGRHANYNIGSQAAKRWVEHMNIAIDEHDELKNDLEASKCLKNYFAHMAHYIVAAMEFMRPDQLSGGTQIDKDRVW